MGPGVDAPLALGLTPTGAVNVAGNDPTSQLVAAVITDLKDHFVAIKSRRRGRAHDCAAGALSAVAYAFKTTAKPHRGAAVVHTPTLIVDGRSGRRPQRYFA